MPENNFEKSFPRKSECARHLLILSCLERWITGLSEAFEFIYFLSNLTKEASGSYQISANILSPRLFYRLRYLV